MFLQSAVSSGPNQSPSPATSMAVTSSAPTPGSPSTTQRCCDTGRLLIDPFTQQTICSCQYELFGQRLAAGVSVMPALPMYNAPYPEGIASYFPALGADQASFYTSTVSKNIKIFLHNYYVHISMQIC